MENYSGIGLEGAFVLFLVVITYKIYKMRIHSTSKCCGDHINVETDNDGGPDV